MPIADRIYAALVRGRDNSRRPHLGPSVIGRPCSRDVWYTFRWASDIEHHGRILRLFRRGAIEEGWVIKDLVESGYAVVAHEKNGTQIRYSAAHSNHISGSVDGVISGLELGPDWSILEIKTHKAKSFSVLSRQGVKASNPEHWAQCQLYMHWSGLGRSIYIAVCKDDDRIHTEAIEPDPVAAGGLDLKAHLVVSSNEPPPRISDRADWWQCKFCDHWGVCHGGIPMAINCRTCAHAVVGSEWTCSVKERPIDLQEQNDGCEHHKQIESTDIPK